MRCAKFNGFAANSGGIMPHTHRHNTHLLREWAWATKRLSASASDVANTFARACAWDERVNRQRLLLLCRYGQPRQREKRERGAAAAVEKQ